MNRDKFINQSSIEVMEVFFDSNRVYLVYRLAANGKTTFKIDASQNGLDFSTLKNISQKDFSRWKKAFKTSKKLRPAGRLPKSWKNKKAKLIGVARLQKQLFSYWQLPGQGIWALKLPYSVLKQKISFSSNLLEKIKNNPILKPIVDHFWESQAVFNPAAVYENGKVHLIYRAVGDDYISVLGYASSKNGRDIDQRLPYPVYFPSKPFESNPKAPKTSSFLYMSGGGFGGCEDPRITKINDRFYLTYVAYNGWGPPRIALTSIKVDDFLNHRWNWQPPVLISKPGVVDKNASILPEKINGKYVIFHRIFPNILIDFVDSLNFDGRTFLKGEYAIKPRENSWDSRKVGIGPPPLKTKEGWLAIYHAVDNNDSSRYKMGAMILKADDPRKVLYRSDSPILEPNKSYENEGYKSGVAYPCGAVIKNQELLVYYGGADSVVCMAKAKLNYFLHQIKTSHRPILKTAPIKLNN